MTEFNLQIEGLKSLSKNKIKFRGLGKDIKEIQQEAENQQAKINEKNNNSPKNITYKNINDILYELEKNNEEYEHKSNKITKIDEMFKESSFKHFELFRRIYLKYATPYKKHLIGNIQRINMRLKLITNYTGTCYEEIEEETKKINIYTSLSYDKLIKLFLTWGAFESSERIFDKEHKMHLEAIKDESLTKIKICESIKLINCSVEKDGITFLDYLGEKSSAHQKNGVSGVNNKNEIFIKNIKKLKNAENIEDYAEVNLFIIAYNIRNLFAHENFTPNSGVSDARISLLIFEKLTEYLLYSIEEKIIREMKQEHYQFINYLYKYTKEHNETDFL